MGEGSQPAPLTSEDLRAIIIDALTGAEPTGGRETFHARFDHPERGISVDDVIYGLSCEWVSCRAERFDRREWQWRYKIVTETIDGEPLVLIVAVDPQNKIFTVITRWTT